MEYLEESINVTFRHRVFFTRDCLVDGWPVLETALADTRRLLVVVEESVAECHPAWRGPQVERLSTCQVGDVMVRTGGEECKQNMDLFLEVVSAIHEHGIDRHSGVLAIGGGAFLDAVGFAAATSHRGVRLIRLPTTTLAQDDSGVGVKCAINLFGKKNFLGSFAVPFAVVNDFAFLDTLPVDLARDGLVEAVKVAVIKDPDFFEWIEENAARLYDLETVVIEQAVQRSAEAHYRHICGGGDPFESGSSRPLDFGHWAAHKLESLSGHELSHARAVAIGIALDSIYARESGRFDERDCERLLAVLERLGFALFHPALEIPGANTLPMVLEGIEEFREHLGGRLTVLLPDAVGRASDVHHLDADLVRRSIKLLAQRAGVDVPA